VVEITQKEVNSVPFPTHHHKTILGRGMNYEITFHDYGFFFQTLLWQKIGR